MLVFIDIVNMGEKENNRTGMFYIPVDDKRNRTMEENMDWLRQVLLVVVNITVYNWVNEQLYY